MGLLPAARIATMTAAAMMLKKTPQHRHRLRFFLFLLSTVRYSFSPLQSHGFKIEEKKSVGLAVAVYLECGLYVMVLIARCSGDFRPTPIHNHLTPKPFSQEALSSLAQPLMTSVTVLESPCYCYQIIHLIVQGSFIRVICNSTANLVCDAPYSFCKI